MKHVSRLLLQLVVIAWTMVPAIAVASSPVVSNIRSSQRTDGSRKVDIWYDCSETDRDSSEPICGRMHTEPQSFANRALFSNKDGQYVRAEHFVSEGELYGDFDGDKDVDQYDYIALQICLSFSGPGLPTPPACYVFDSDQDVDIDLHDVAAFNAAWTGPLARVIVEAGSLFPALASSDEYYSGEPGAQGSNALRGIARHAGYSQDDLWYAWSVIDQPEQSGQVTIGNPSRQDTPFLISSPFLAGEYQFKLAVMNLITGESGFDVTMLRSVNCLSDNDCTKEQFCDSINAVCRSIDSIAFAADFEKNLVGEFPLTPTPGPGTCSDLGPLSTFVEQGFVGGSDNSLVLRDEVIEVFPQGYAEVSLTLGGPVSGRVRISWDAVVTSTIGGDQEWVYSVFAAGSSSQPGNPVLWDISLVGDSYRISIFASEAPFRPSTEQEFRVEIDTARQLFSAFVDGVRITDDAPFNNSRAIDLSFLGIQTYSESACVVSVDNLMVTVLDDGCASHADCNDHDLCTIDICDPSSGCHYEPVCDDGLFCNGTEVCDPETGSCIAEYQPCPPGTLCIENADTCVDQSPLELVGQWGGGITAFEHRGAYSYAGVGPRLAVLDTSNPATPLPVGRTGVLPGVVRDLQVIEDLAYVLTSHDSLQVINVASKQAPFVVGVADALGGAVAVTSMAVSNDAAFVTSHEGLAIIDISSPYEPSVIGQLESPGSQSWDIALGPTHAYISTEWNGLQIVDITNLAAPFYAETVDTGDAIRGVVISGQHLFVDSLFTGINIFEISDPLSPTLVSQYDPSVGGVWGFDVRTDYMYLVKGWAGLEIVDVSSPSSPVFVSDLSLGGYPGIVYASTEHLFTASSDSGLEVVNVMDHTSPYLEGGYSDGGHNVEVIEIIDEHAVLASSTNFEILNISNTLAPYRVASLPIGCQGREIEIENNIAYVACGSDGLVIINLSDLGSPSLVAQLFSPRASAVAKFGDLLWVTTWSEDGSYLIDVTDPAHPSVHSQVITSGRPCDVSISDGYAYVANDQNGLEVFDVTTPTNPVLVSTLDLGGFSGAWYVTLDEVEPYAYVSDSRVHVVGIENPSSPEHLYTFAAGGNVHSVVSQGNWLAFSSPWQTYLADISNPRSPVIVGTSEPLGAAGLALNGDTLYNAERRGGLTIQDIGGVPHDLCQFALPVELGTREVRNIGATFDALSSPSCVPVGSDVWFLLTAPVSGVATVDLCKSDFDTVLSVYDGSSCTPLATPIACVDDSECEGIFTARSSIDFDVEAGSQYLIQIGGYSGAQGLGIMEISILP